MNQILFRVVMFVILAGIVGGCSPSPIAVAPTHAAFALPTLIPPTKVPPTPTVAPTAPPVPTSTPSPVPPTATMTVQATQSALAAISPTGEPLVRPSATPSVAPETPRIASPTAGPSPAPLPTLAPSPTPAIAAGVYITDLRTDPPPVRGPDLTFYATFLNSIGREQNVRWAVYIFRPDTQRSTGETTRTDTMVPAGTTEQPSLGSWRLPLGGPCDYFYAQVAWINTENKPVWFTTSSGSTFQKVFAVCPP